MTNVTHRWVLRKWKDVPGEQFKGLQASKDGVIRYGQGNGLYRTHLDTKGYIHISFKSISYPVHRLVCLAWNKKIRGKDYVNHKDGNKANNSAANLEWCTVTENNRHSYHVLDNNSQYPKRRVEIYKDGELVATKISVREAAKFVKGASTNVSKVCYGIRKSHNGYMFKYAETQPITQPVL